MALESELAVFEQKKAELLRTMRGQYALIHGDSIDSTWKSENEAFEAGCDRFGPEPFLVMLIEDPEPAIPFHQDIALHAGRPSPA